MRTSYRRVAVQAIEDHIDPPVRGAEIGVWRGGLSHYLLSNLPSLVNLFLVDPWKEWVDGERYKEAGHRLVTEDQEANYRMAMESVMEFKYRVTVLRMVSLEAAQRTDDASLDFVLIDADHSYQGCMEDLVAWFPKVRPGGLLMGHDYGSRKWGVKRAVNEFVAQKGLGLQVYPKSVWASQVPM